MPSLTQPISSTAQVFNLLGIPISATTPSDALAQIHAWAADRKGRYIGVRDVASLMTMAEDPALLQVAQQAAMNVPDGMPLVWLGRWRGFSVERTCGPDLMDMMLSEGPKSGLKHFLYGGKEGVADRIVERFQARADCALVVGTYSPPFRALTDAEDAEVVREITESGADVLWVGMSSPKQDVWMAKHVDRLQCTMVGVGAAFDFHAGTVRRAPLWMQRSGFEWAFRLMLEPKRLWRRYLVQAPKFVFRLLVSKRESL